LLRLGCAMFALNFVVVAIATAVLSIYASTALRSTLHTYGANPTWFAWFTVVCGFNQAGFALVRDGLIPFNHDTFFVLVLCANLLIGNAFLPLVMRGVLTVCARHSRDPAPWKFLLEHPRICSTTLFPSLQTKMLSGIPSLAIPFLPLFPLKSAVFTQLVKAVYSTFV
jgi:Trk-type K+ transport system membrane component